MASRNTTPTHPPSQMLQDVLNKAYGAADAFGAKTRSDYEDTRAKALLEYAGQNSQRTVPPPPNLIIIGAGAHGRMLMATLKSQSQRIAGFVDVSAALAGTLVENQPVSDTIESLATLYGVETNHFRLVNGVGNSPQIGDSQLAQRAEVYAQFTFKGYQFADVVAEDVTLSAHGEWDGGVQIMPRCFIGPYTRIGANVLINSCVQLDHDCVIGAHSHIAPGAILCGNVRVGNAVHVGAGAIIIQGVTIGDGAVIGAGAVVTEDVPAGASVLPARGKVVAA